MDMNRNIEILVRADESQGKQDHFWRYIGYDECNYTYMPEGKQLLNIFGQMEDAPYFMRTHFMLCTGNCQGAYKFGSTNLYTEDAEGNPVYDFTVYDRILDQQIASGNIPFVELGFMPYDLADTAYAKGAYGHGWHDTYMRYGWSFPPKSYDKWYDMIKTLAQHLLEKYGEETLNTWDFELWNEPDIFYWSGSAADYCKLFDYTEHAFHSVLPDARLSGPATTGPFEGSNSQYFLRYFLQHCKDGNNYYTQEKGTRLDFITFHVKGGGFSYVVPARAKEENPSIESLLLQVRVGLDVIKECGYGDKEVVLSEADPDGWAAGNMYDNPNMVFRNTEYYASYVASSYTGIEKLASEYNMVVRPLAWGWTFPGETCFAGTRAFTTQFIEKPVLHAMRMLSFLGDEKVALESTGVSQNTRELADISGIAAKKGDELGIMFYSHIEDKEASGFTPVKLTVSGLKAGAVLKAAKYAVDKDHSNGYEEWLRQGSPAFPEGEVYEAIRDKGYLEAPEEWEVQVAEDGTVSMEWELPLHGVWFVSLK